MVDVPDWYAKPLADYPAGYLMGLVCRRCRHGRTVPFAELLARMPAGATVGDLAARGRCTHVAHDPLTSAPRPPCGGMAEAWPRADVRGWRGLAPPALRCSGGSLFPASASLCSRLTASEEY